MREFLRRGGSEQCGLDDLRRQVQQRRRDLLAADHLDGTLQQVRELLDRAVLAERKQLARDLDDDARFAEMRLENLPASTAAAVTALVRLPVAQQRGAARTTSRSRTCSAASCSTSASPA